MIDIIKYLNFILLTISVYKLYMIDKNSIDHGDYHLGSNSGSDHNGGDDNGGNDDSDGIEEDSGSDGIEEDSGSDGIEDKSENLSFNKDITECSYDNIKKGDIKNDSKSIFSLLI